MSNVIFLQFYYNLDGSLVICNGLSDTYDLCNSYGDMFWADEHRLDDIVFPFNKGKIYISAVFMNHLLQTIKWTEQYPDIKFIVGGPIVGFDAVQSYKPYFDIPNLIMTTQSIEEYFNVEQFCGKWRLPIDKINVVGDYDTIYFGYTVTNKPCYWSKCNFCSMPPGINRTRTNWDMSCINDIPFEGTKLARLTTNALTLANIKTILPNLKYDDDIFYDVYLRGTQKECDALEKVLSRYDVIPNLKFRMGVEFPSDRLLNHANKGTTKDGLINTINMLKSYDNVQVYINFIKNWPDIIPGDIDHLRNFTDRVQMGNIEKVVAFDLFCPVGSKFHSMYKNRIKKKMYSGPVYKGFFPKLTDEETKLNQQAFDIIDQMSNQVMTWKSNYLGKDKGVF